MLRRVISVLCLALLLVPVLTCPALAYDKSSWSVLDKQYEMKAQALPNRQDREIENGYFWIMSDSEETIARYAPEEISLDVEKPFWQNLVNSIFHHGDYSEILALLETTQRNYFSAVASGAWRIFDRTYFVDDDIYEETNARTLYMTFKIPGAGNGTDRGEFGYHLDDVEISGDQAKVILTRSAETIENEPDGETAYRVTVIEDAVREGYLLQKVEDEWKIANIIFDESENWDGDPDRIFNDSYTAVNTLNLFADAKEPEVWQSGFSFENCQREMYSPYGNYMSYIEGPIESPVFLYEKLTYERDDPSATLEGWEQMQEGTAS